MPAWLSSLSRAQRFWFVLILASMAGIMAAGLFLERGGDSKRTGPFDVGQSLSEIAPKVGVTGKALARELGLPLEVPKKKPLEDLGVTRNQLDHATEHLLSHQTGGLKYFLFAALVLGALVFLARLGRPDGSGPGQRKSWFPRWVHVLFLATAVVVGGALLGKSPNPMEGAVTVFKSMVGLYPDPATKVLVFAFFLGLAIVGNKLVCGWVCPFGALQELVYSLPVLRSLKKRKLPFWVSNGVRIALFVVALLLLFDVVGGRKGFVIYHFVNPFNLFNLDFDALGIVVAVIASLALGFVLYRPFCQLVCPFGLMGWVVEPFSLFAVRIDRDRCTECGACVRACPVNAARDRKDGRFLAAECYSCGRCLNVCPADAVRYGTPLLGAFTRRDSATVAGREVAFDGNAGAAPSGGCQEDGRPAGMASP